MKTIKQAFGPIKRKTIRIIVSDPNGGRSVHETEGKNEYEFVCTMIIGLIEYREMKRGRIIKLCY